MMCSEPVSSEQPYTLKTKLGDVMGIRKTVNNGSTNVFSFLNIPYAKPPIGDLRFAKPEPFE